MSCLTSQNLKAVGDEQQRQLDLMNETIDKLVADTPRMISIEMYVRTIAQNAYVSGWNNRAAESGREVTR